MIMSKEKEEFLKFKAEINALVDKYGVELYTEDQQGHEDHMIMAYKSGVFDGIVLGGDEDAGI